MKKIPLTQGLEAIVDDVDFERLSQFKWFAKASRHRVGKTWYAARHQPGNNNGAMIWMHREVLGVKTNVDHKNQNGLDNRRENLRAASKSRNAFNTPKRGGRNGRAPSSSYKGVHRYGDRWQACITVDGKIVRLGPFEEEVAAAKAYDNAAVKAVGEFAYLNFPKESGAL